MQFVYQPLAWGFLLVLVPLLIHLINLLRHRRQRWAAMEFLLESYRKHKRWVWLKQFLLLLSRMAMMAVLVMLLAQWVSGSKWLSMFGQSVTHHYILLDDSLSMADQVTAGQATSGQIQTGSAYQAGLRAISNLLRSVADDSGSHQTTIFRYSRCEPIAAPKDIAKDTSKDTPKNASADPVLADASATADVLARTIPSNPDSILERLNSTRPFALDVSPIKAIQNVSELISQATGEQAVVYLVGDFRDKDWRQNAQIKSALEPIGQKNVNIELIDCAAIAHENLSIVSLVPDEEILAASVPLMMRVEVRNNGQTAVKNVNVTLKQYEFDASQTQPRVDRFASGNESTLPPLVIDTIAPGETAVARTQMVFGKSGSQVVQATLNDDALLEDNSFSAVLDILEGQELLVIDGDDRRMGAFFLEATLNPGGMTRTGWKTRSEGPGFLRDNDASVLSKFASIVLMKTTSLDPRAIANLESYVRAGGGLAIFLGGNLTEAELPKWNRDWYRDGQGLSPMPATSIVELPRQDLDSATPDILPQPHPIFAPLLGSSNSPLQFVRVSKYVRLDTKSKAAGSDKALKSPDASTQPPSDLTLVAEADTDPKLFRSTPQVVASLRDGSPLIVDHGLGKGHVVLTSIPLDPDWTNWPQDPTFVVAILKMTGYLASFRITDFQQRVGIPVAWDFSSRDYLPEVEAILGASGKSIIRSSIGLIAKPSKEPNLLAQVDPNAPGFTDEQVRAALSTGVTEFWATSLQGNRFIKSFARNAPAIEGELKKISSADLLLGLQGLPVKYRVADSVLSSSALAGLTNRQGFLLALLIGLLLIEQFLAWSASFHLPRRATA